MADNISLLDKLNKDIKELQQFVSNLIVTSSVDANNIDALIKNQIALRKAICLLEEQNKLLMLQIKILEIYVLKEKKPEKNFFKKLW